jgi:hypothetical protein
MNRKHSTIAITSDVIANFFSGKDKKTAILIIEGITFPIAPEIERAIITVSSWLDIVYCRKSANDAGVIFQDRFVPLINYTLVDLISLQHIYKL